MEFLPKKLPAIIVLPALCAALFCFAGCSTSDKYHNKKHVDTFKKDMNSMHKDIDRMLGIDAPSTLVED
ncbi:MAG: hypothetical protein HW390_1009 [Candidatus Brocadiaceae bacterium]|nr:hypothetical protein [Candidatus Brocadiaceae bacterium]